MDRRGGAVFTWTRFDESSLACCFRVEARSRSAAGALRPFTVLSDHGMSATVPRVAVDDDGDAALAWIAPHGASYRIQASAGP
jgi:hypothetical protein